MHFGPKKKTDKSLNISQALERLRETEQLLTKRQEFLEKRIQQELTTAKTAYSRNKSAAIQALKKKKRLEIQLQQLDGTLTTIEVQRESLEAANTNAMILLTMKKAADALKLANNQLGIDNVNDMMDDIGEQQDVAKEISEAISHNYYNTGIDESELEKELEALEEEALVEELLKVGPSTAAVKNDLPKVPSQTLMDGTKEDDEESEEKDDVDKLKAWAGLNG
ncbi:charged multivesicular body protein 4-like [Onthophagus taurus]|uniref:charged multivesicular body protein 4-like n=1 Tax=Onthophagus taurus TaxID=166361 RepID=UPI0039BEBD91